MIPDGNNHLIPYPIETIHSNTVVADLIDTDHGMWKEDLVRCCFLPADASHILKFLL